MAATAPPASAATRATTPTTGVSRQRARLIGRGVGFRVIGQRVHAPCVLQQGAVVRAGLTDCQLSTARSSSSPSTGGRQVLPWQT